MKQKFAAALATAALITGGAVAVAPAADAAGCVTQREFSHAKKGMTKTKVAHIFGTKGRRSSYASSGGYTAEVRSYKTCTPYGSVAVSYMNGRLQAKSGVF